MNQCLKGVYLKQGSETRCGSSFCPQQWCPLQRMKQAAGGEADLGHDTSLTLNLFNMGQGRTTNFAGCHLLQTISYSDV